MVSSISAPSPKYDDPYPVEGTLAGLVDDPRHPSATPMLNAYQSERRRASGEYTDYLRVVNALQAQAMAGNQKDDAVKNLISMVTSGKDQPGAMDFYSHNPISSGYIAGTPVSDLEGHAFGREWAKNFNEYAGGMKSMSDAGVQTYAGQENQFGPLGTVTTGLNAGVAGSLARPDPAGVPQQTSQVTGIPDGKGGMIPVRKVDTSKGPQDAPTSSRPSPSSFITARPGVSKPTDTPLPQTQSAPAANPQATAPADPKQQAAGEQMFKATMSQLKASHPDVYKDVVEGGGRYTVNQDGSIVLYGKNKPSGYIIGGKK